MIFHFTEISLKKTFFADTGMMSSDPNPYNGIIRWYEPVTGRWLSNDPIGISGGLNMYAAFVNNPVNFRDPSGLDAFRGFGQGMTENVTGSASAGAWPGAGPAISGIQANTIADAVNAGLCDLGQAQPPGNIQPYLPDFARVNSPSFAANWSASTSGHGSAYESGLIPGSPYVVKYYNDPTRGQISTVTPPTSSLAHWTEAYQFSLLSGLKPL